MAIKANIADLQSRITIGKECRFTYLGTSKPKKGQSERTKKPRHGIVFHVDDKIFKMASPEHIGPDGQPTDYSTVRSYRWDSMPALVSVK